jgi:hypothetical protein
VTLQVGQTVAPLSDVRLDGENLSYAIPALEVRCSLMRQKDGGFAGKCAPLNAGGGFQMTMIPPKPTIPPK